MSHLAKKRSRGSKGASIGSRGARRAVAVDGVPTSRELGRLSDEAVRRFREMSDHCSEAFVDEAVQRRARFRAEVEVLLSFGLPVIRPVTLRPVYGPSVPGHCWLIECSAELPEHVGRGARRKYCNDICACSKARQMARNRSRGTRARQGAVPHPGTESD